MSRRGGDALAASQKGFPDLYWSCRISLLWSTDGWSHVYGSRISEEEFERQIRLVDEALEKILGIRCVPLPSLPRGEGRS